MMNYEELVDALRCKRDDCEGCDLAFFDKDEGWMCQYAAKDDDAADEIEALNRLVDLNTERCEGLRKQLREAQEQYEKNINELEKELSFSESTYEEFQIVAATQNALLAKQLPKRGEWVEREVIQDRRDARIPEWQQAKCSVCGKWHTTPYMYCFDDFDYCPNCGAKMEAQDG